MLIFEWGMKNVWANPLWGIGLNEWVRPWFMHSGSMDNFWLVVAVRYGIPGFLLTSIGFSLVIWKVMWRDFDADPVLWRLRRAWVITMVGLVLTLCTVDVWATAYSYIAFLLGTGVWFISAEPADQNATGEKSDDNMGQGGYARSAAKTRQVAPSRYTRFPTDNDNAG
jgi:hypothetical protein